MAVLRGCGSSQALGAWAPGFSAGSCMEKYYGSAAQLLVCLMDRCEVCGSESWVFLGCWPRWTSACVALMWRNEVGTAERSRVWSQSKHCPWDEWKLQC